MAFKSVGTMDLGTHTAQGASAAAGGNAGRFAMDAAGIASGQAFLTSGIFRCVSVVAGLRLCLRCL